MKDKVSIVKCDTYEKCCEGVDEALRLIGGIERFVKPGDKVVIKPNLVSKKEPGKAITTNPEFVKAVVRIAEAAGGIVTIAESPGGPYNRTMLNAVYGACGMNYAVEGTNAQLNYSTDFTEVDHKDGHTVKRIPIIDPVLDADVVINLPKLKTHAMTSYTGAVKNLFGVIPGTYKAELHFRLDDRKAFCSMLVDLCERVGSVLTIMDAIDGMEGNGPTSGTDRHIGLVLASENPYELDMAACDIIGYETDEVDTVRFSIERGHAVSSYDELNIVGCDIADVMIPDFAKPESHFNLLKLVNLPSALNAFFVNKLASRPEIQYKECISCGECARCCPPKAISMDSGRPVINRQECIRCFCCQELCPKSAVKIKRSLLNKFMIKIVR